MCKLCMDNQNLIFRFDVENVAMCKDCNKMGHKKCVNLKHTCKMTPETFNKHF